MTRNIIIGLGLLGIAVVGRAAMAYVGTDAVALAMCVVMALVLVAGVADLLASTSRLEGLRGELANVVKSPSASTIEGASPDLRGRGPVALGGHHGLGGHASRSHHQARVT